MTRWLSALLTAAALFLAPAAFAQSIVVPVASGGGSDCTTACTYTDTQTITLGAADHKYWALSGGSITGSSTTPAIDIAMTLNTTGAVDAVRWVFTCTSCSNANEFAIYGGASGTTQHFSVSRTGAITNLGNITFGAGASFCSLSRACLSSPNAGTWDFDNSSAGSESVWLSTVDLNGTLILGKRPSATPTARVLRGESSIGGTSSNVGGADVTLQAGAGTGSGTPSKIVLQSPVTNGTATLAQTQVTGLTIYNGMALLPQYAVSGLPTCNAAAKGGMVFVTDATSPTYNGTLTGGGAVGVPAACDGSAWHSV